MPAGRRFQVRFGWTLLLTLVLLCVQGGVQAAERRHDDPRPNIIVILSDDMGYSDLGCYGSEIETPNLNRLAKQGLRLTQFYNTGRCCPTRASLLTGLYPHQAGIGHMTEDHGLPGYRGDLNDRCRTIAEVLKPAGYRTYMAGKWHVTKHLSPDGPKDNWPRQRGFDRFYGTIIGAGSFYDPYTLCRDNTYITPENDPHYQPDNYYYTDAISDNAVAFLQDHHRDQEQPFFLYVAYTAAHWPMHALPEDIAKYEGRYDAGYETIRRERFQRMRRLGLLDPSTRLSPADESWADQEHRAWEARCMEVYAAMVDRMDQGIGRIIACLEAEGELENTLILFLQDNGGCAEGMGRRDNPAWHLQNLKPLGRDELQTTLWPPMQTRDGRPVLGGPGVMPGPADTYIAYGQGWANVSNTPFRLYKHWVHEGGIATPLIAHWPTGIKRGGELDDEPGHLIDIMATCVDVAKADYPKQVDDRPITALEGRSLVPVFQGQPLERAALYWEHEGNRAIRQGDWKLVARGADGDWELYDLSRDRSELDDLAATYPERVAQMSADFDAFARRADVYPLVPWRRPKAEEKTSFNRQQDRFELGPETRLSRDQAPYVVEADLTLEGTVRSDGSDGVLLAQGGSADGFALFVQDQQLTWAVRRGGTLHEWTCQAPLAAGQHEVQLHYPRQGELSIRIDGRLELQAQSPGPLTRMPIDGLQVGRDDQGLVGSYPVDSAFGGSSNWVLELTR